MWPTIDHEDRRVFFCTVHGYWCDDADHHTGDEPSQFVPYELSWR